MEVVVMEHDEFNHTEEMNAGENTEAREEQMPVNEAASAEPAAADEQTYERPERSAYSDAGYIPTADTGAVPKSYHCAASTEKRTKKEKRPRRGMRPAAVVALCLICAILGGLAGGMAPQWLNRDTAAATETAEPSRALPAADSTTDAADTAKGTDSAELSTSGTLSRTVTTTAVSAADEMSATDIYYQLALNQVVGVTTEITYTNVFGYTSKGAVSGSGFIISEDGYILTNHHVIKDAVTGGYDVQVLTSDGQTYIATVVGYEEDNDVAVLKVDATGLNAATIGDSDDMLVGEKVYAVGNPLGELEYTMTDGIVSAKDREITSTDSQTKQTTTINMFQISAAINSGNSGGPVYNGRGEVIGISTAKYSETGVEGLGFAIPINDAVRIASDLISDGYVRGKAYMGIKVGTVTASAAQYYGLVQGAIVASVEEDSCAAKAGLQESDIIVAIDGKEVTTGNELITLKKNYSAGDSAVLKVYRESSYIELTIVFDEATPERMAAEQTEDSQQTETNQPGSGNEWSYSDDTYDFFREFFGGLPFGR